MHTLVLIPLLALPAAAVPSLSSDKPPTIIPEYDVAFAHTDAARPESSSAINKRTDFSGAKITCDNKGFYACPLDIYDEQLSYLRKLHGQPRMDPGPEVCSRSREEKTLLAWTSIIDGLKAIRAKCGPSEKESAVNGGRARHPTDWEVRWEHLPNGEHC
ncbi:hypothetical protein PCL_08225 [Purpureocillium lilacinum]|uniref:Uncharacterized protein n=1 Tax=Purpureocillium lilacinum TaxID=33203 RepID=A0A2U3EK90_PURLI|nr:hypothetical protein PCL_08225 [Purpureocillium lilacinum]